MRNRIDRALINPQFGTSSFQCKSTAVGNTLLPSKKLSSRSRSLDFAFQAHQYRISSSISRRFHFHDVYQNMPYRMGFIDTVGFAVTKTSPITEKY